MKDKNKIKYLKQQLVWTENYCLLSQNKLKNWIIKPHEILGYNLENFIDILIYNKIIPRDYYRGNIYRNWTERKYLEHYNINKNNIGCNSFLNNIRYSVIRITSIDENWGWQDDYYCLIWTQKGIEWLKNNIEKWEAKYIMNKLTEET